MHVSVQDAAVFAAPPFHRLVPARAGYQTLPIADGFNWSYTLEEIPSGHWHLIVFRSVRSVSADNDLLARHDDLAFAEALAAGGLLRYYKGVPDRNHNCLSLCIWLTRHHAVRATDLPDHRAAAAIARHSYDRYDVQRLEMHKRPGRLDPEFRLVA